MDNLAALEEILRGYLAVTKNPYLNSMNGLPASVLNDLVGDLVKTADVRITEDNMTIAFDMRRFTNRITGAIKREVIMDEVGMLIEFGASKNVISEITGVHQSKIVTKRKMMKADLPKQGRPRKLDPGEVKMITEMWNRLDGCKSTKLIRTHIYTAYPINDVWLVIRSNDAARSAKKSGVMKKVTKNVCQLN